MASYRSTFSHGLSDNIRSPQTRTRTRTDGSDSDRCTVSSVSFTSDQSKKDIITFNKTPYLLRPYPPGVSITMESYWSPFVHELSADPSPLLEWLKALESYWPTDSTELWDMETRARTRSLKKDQSKDITKGKRSSLRVPLKHKASTGSNCSSIKTDRSQDFIDANKRCLRTRTRSFKKDQSKDITKGKRSSLRLNDRVRNLSKCLRSRQ